MKTTKFEITGEIEIQYDEDNENFQEALEGYVDIDDMLAHVAFYVTRFGHYGMVEGVGYVGFDGDIPNGEPYSGIMIMNDYEDFEFDQR